MPLSDPRAVEAVSHMVQTSLHSVLDLYVHWSIQQHPELPPPGWIGDYTIASHHALAFLYAHKHIPLIRYWKAALLMANLPDDDADLALLLVQGLMDRESAAS